MKPPTEPLHWSEAWERADGVVKLEATARLMAHALLRIQASRRGGKGGQMLSAFVCAVCNDECGHENTATPFMCKRCEEQLRRIV